MMSFFQAAPPASAFIVRFKGGQTRKNLSLLHVETVEKTMAEKISFVVKLVELVGQSQESL
jgi:hypothetical protein